MLGFQQAQCTNPRTAENGRSWFSLWSSTSKVRLEKGVPVNNKLLAARPLLNNILTIVDKILGSLQLMFFFEVVDIFMTHDIPHAA